MRPELQTAIAMVMHMSVFHGGTGFYHGRTGVVGWIVTAIVILFALFRVWQRSRRR